MACPNRGAARERKCVRLRIDRAAAAIRVRRGDGAPLGDVAGVGNQPDVAIAGGRARRTNAGAAAGERIDVAVRSLQADLRGLRQSTIAHGAFAARLHEHLLAARRILQQHLLAHREFRRTVGRAHGAGIDDRLPRDQEYVAAAGTDLAEVDYARIRSA